MNMLWVVSLMVLAFASVQADAQSTKHTPSGLWDSRNLGGTSNTDINTSCGPRTRRDWDSMSSAEKDTYKRAIAAAMDSGAYIKFSEIHMEMQSEKEAHRQCMFTYWHRLFLVVFENMLRAQGEEFACVTVPYFNWVGAYNRVLSAECFSLGDCTAIATELGGFGNGPWRRMTINGRRTSGTCESEAPLDHFCQSSSVSGSECAGCLIRGNWGAASVPASTSFASVREQVFSGKTIGEMSPLVERGCHNNVHANLGSTFGTFAAPADPLFWSHHAMVDALHTIFHKCRVGTKRMTFKEKASHPVAWTSCSRRDGGAFRPEDEIVMRTGERGVNTIDARDDPLIGKFFDGVPTQFAGLMDVRDLGANSYSYELSGQLAAMYTECDGGSGRHLEEDDNDSEEGEKPSCTTADSAEREAEPVTDGNLDVFIVDGVYDAAEELVTAWYDETLEAMGGQSSENMADMERQVCMFENQCLGGTPDYSNEFKMIWGAVEPRCLTIVNAIASGEQSMLQTTWRENMETRFGCPKPVNATTSTKEEHSDCDSSIKRSSGWH